MKKKVTIILLTGFVALISGLILCGVGYFMGGIEDIETIATPHLTEETYQDIREINLNFQTREVRVEQSPDDKFHIRYTNFDTIRYHPLSLEQDKHLLTIQEKKSTLHVQGIMQFLGQELAIRRNNELQALTVLVPKGKTIEKLSGFSYTAPISLSNVRIKQLDWGGHINGSNVTMEGGTINASNSRDLYFTNSHLKNMTIEAPLATQSYQTSTLENVNIQKASTIYLHDTTILGTTKIETSSQYQYPSYLNIDLSEKSKKDTDLDVTVTYDWSQLRGESSSSSTPSIDSTSDEITDAHEDELRKEYLEQMGIKVDDDYKNLTIEENKNGAKATYTSENATNKLILQATNGQIILGSLEAVHY